LFALQSIFGLYIVKMDENATGEEPVIKQVFFYIQYM